MVENATFFSSEQGNALISDGERHHGINVKFPSLNRGQMFYVKVIRWFELNIKHSLSISLFNDPFKLSLEYTVKLNKQ